MLTQSVLTQNPQNRFSLNTQSVHSLNHNRNSIGAIGTHSLNRNSNGAQKLCLGKKIGARRLQSLVKKNQSIRLQRKWSQFGQEGHRALLFVSLVVMVDLHTDLLHRHIHLHTRIIPRHVHLPIVILLHLLVYLEFLLVYLEFHSLELLCLVLILHSIHTHQDMLPIQSLQGLLLHLLVYMELPCQVLILHYTRTH